MVDRSYYTKLGTTSTEGYPKSMMTLNPKMLLLLENTALTSNLWSRPSVVKRFEEVREPSEDEEDEFLMDWCVCYNKKGAYRLQNYITA